MLSLLFLLVLFVVLNTLGCKLCNVQIVQLEQLLFFLLLIAIFQVQCLLYLISNIDLRKLFAGILEGILPLFYSYSSYFSKFLLEAIIIDGLIMLVLWKGGLVLLLGVAHCAPQEVKPTRASWIATLWSDHLPRRFSILAIWCFQFEVRGWFHDLLIYYARLGFLMGNTWHLCRNIKSRVCAVLVGCHLALSCEWLTGKQSLVIVFELWGIKVCAALPVGTGFCRFWCSFWETSLTFIRSFSIVLVGRAHSLLDRFLLLRISSPVASLVILALSLIQRNKWFVVRQGSLMCFCRTACSLQHGSRFHCWPAHIHWKSSSVWIFFIQSLILQGSEVPNKDLVVWEWLGEVCEDLSGFVVIMLLTKVCGFKSAD